MTNRIARALALTGVAALAATAVPSRLHAQAKAEFTPFVGSFYALAKMCSDCNNDGSNLRGRLQNSAVFGGRLSYRISNSLGIEASGAFTPARIEISAQDTTGFSLAASAKGNLLLTNARLLYRPARTNLHFIIGGGIVHRGGDIWKLAHDSANVKTTSVTGVLGVSVRAAVTPKFALSISAEDHLYSFDPGFGPFSDPSNGKKLQSDVLITIGIPVTLSR
jgi:Outer membrane protein beta-barrel domain